MRHIDTAILFLCTICGLLTAQVTNQAITGQQFQGEITIGASVEEITAVLLSPKQMKDIKEYEFVSGKTELSKVGDFARLKIWGDNGNFLLVAYTPGKEVRTGWEPDNGSYLCQQQWLFEKVGNKTRVHFLERYTESGPQTPESIKSQVQSQNSSLKRLKEACEK